MIYWVVAANCIRQPFSLLFSHSRIRKRGGNDNETTSLQLASDMPYATRVTTLWLNNQSFSSVWTVNSVNRLVKNQHITPITSPPKPDRYSGNRIPQTINLLITGTDLSLTIHVHCDTAKLVINNVNSARYSWIIDGHAALITCTRITRLCIIDSEGKVLMELISLEYRVWV